MDVTNLALWTSNNSRLVHRAAAGTSDSPLFTYSTPTSLASGGFLLYVGSQYPAAAPRDGALSTGLAPAGGGIGLIYQSTYTGGTSSLIVDSVGYGTATNIYVEGTAAAAPASASSIRRRPDGTDTNTNSADFTTTTTPTPRASNG